LIVWRILTNLYLGDEQDAHNRALLEHFGITHILNCAHEVPCVFAGGFRYLHLELTDPEPAFADCITEICRFIRTGRRKGAVLVHCRMGLSRSPAAILAYLCHRGFTVAKGLRLLRKGVREGEEFTEPHEVFLEQLRDYFELEEDEDG
jgi:protein-tyrosine phosphatase